MENLPDFIAGISEWGKNLGVDVASDVLEGLKEKLPDGIGIAKNILKRLEGIPGIDEALKELDSIEYIDGIDEALKSLESVRKLKIFKDKKGKIKIKGMDEALKALESVENLEELQKSLESEWQKVRKKLQN